VIEREHETEPPMTTSDAVSVTGENAVFHRVVLSLGSNLGDRLENLQHAVDALFDAPGLEFAALSPVYETAPVGGPPQPDYLNIVVSAGTALSPRTLLERVQGIEEALLRERRVRWGPRTLDIDIIAVGGFTSDDPDLTLPHPRAHERAFVLAPWRDIDPDAQLAGHGRVAEILDRVGSAGVHRRDDLRLQAPA
jgi:2-amino-4-hydroxy-6-hydroxymethyldihydropteridine diphosphokinase